jgi:acetyltransferase-like isoleucine patch superfamily enzyme
MIHGQSYAIDAELLLERHRCELACRNFNRWETESAPLSSTNLGLFLQVLCLEHPQSPSLHQPAARPARLGRDVSVQKPFFCHYGYNISIGDFVKIGPNCHIHDACHVTIGEQCSIAANVTIIADLPGLYPDSRRLGLSVGKPISIGPYCYIGEGAIIMPGCVIGMGSFIYPGAVVDTVCRMPFSVNLYTKDEYSTSRPALYLQAI